VLHKEIPFLRIGLPLCVGILSGLYLKPDIVFLFIATVIIITGFVLSLLFNKSLINYIFGYSLTLSLYVIGLFLYSREKDNISILKHEQTVFACTLDDFPVEKENSYMLKIKLNSRISKDECDAVKGSMILYNRKDITIASFLPGDLLIIRCKPVEIINKGNPYEFDYKFYMENHGIKYYAFTNSRDIIKHIVPVRRKLVHKALIIREKIINMYKERGITGERLAIVAAITLGQKNMLDPEQKQNFIRAGVMHIMAVSGMHVVILCLFIFNILFFLKRRFNFLRILITILCLWSFAFITGLTASVLRAAFMFTFLQAGTILNRKVNGINSVLASAFILILIRPSVIFETGFLLSYSAVIYIISFYDDLYHKFQFKNWSADKIWQSAAVTLVAQAGTLSLTIMLFNRFPTYFILTNILLLPLSTMMIILGCLVPLLFPVQFLSNFLGMILNNLTGVADTITSRVSSLPWSNIEEIGMTTVECILLTVTIFLFCHYLLKRKTFSIIYPLSSLFLFVIADTVLEISNKTTNEIIVYNTPGSQTIGIRTGKILNVYSDNSRAGPEVIKHSSTLGLKIIMNPIKNKLYCIRAGNKSVLISDFTDKKLRNKFKPDIVVLTGILTGFEKNISEDYLPEVLVITSGILTGFKPADDIFYNSVDSVHFVNKSGSFIKSL